MILTTFSLHNILEQKWHKNGFTAYAFLFDGYVMVGYSDAEYYLPSHVNSSCHLIHKNKFCNPPQNLFFITKHQPSNAWTSSATSQTATQLMGQFPAPRSLYLVQGSLDQISVSHPTTHTYIAKPSETRRSLYSDTSANEWPC